VLLHVFAVLVAVSTAVLIFAGGLVTSTGSGLSVPDWPNSYGWFMFTFPLEHMVGGIFYEHSHRLIASTVGFLILVEALWLWRVEKRRWVARLGGIALAAVITQGILGGITVLWYLPDPISIAHASMAQLVFCLTTTIALATSPGWARAYRPREPSSREGVLPPAPAPSAGPALETRTALSTGTALEASTALHADAALRAIASVTVAAIYLQIVIGATMRHTDAGLAIPDFPWAFGRLVPPHWDAKIAVHFAHRVGALIVTTLVLATTSHVCYRHWRRSELVRPSFALLALVATQVTLGALTVLSGKHYVINSMHVVTGGLVLVTMLVLTLRAHRARFSEERTGRTAHTAPEGVAHTPAGVRA
jgi:cytochrome c oxidase assembly protein subunit 15